MIKWVIRVWQNWRLSKSRKYSSRSIAYEKSGAGELTDKDAGQFFPDTDH